MTPTQEAEQAQAWRQWDFARFAELVEAEARRQEQLSDSLFQWTLNIKAGIDRIVGLFENGRQGQEPPGIPGSAPASEAPEYLRPHLEPETIDLTAKANRRPSPEERASGAGMTKSRWDA